eukprot:TRINITY_DN11300_c0_g1_i4.p1 TRINITY_DN11300_c0_g1~~TRINITY_DN11300_c0_g1_i4.p1  ORF type:complete len:167 (+),score=4.27 TRINITY_DN11300_c0_g1_i4:169-669(+)
METEREISLLGKHTGSASMFLFCIETRYLLLIVTGPTEFNTEWIHNLPDINEKWFIAGDFNAHSSFWNKGCQTVSCNRFVENIVDSNLYLLNDGSITRIPDISSHRPSATDPTLLSPILASECKWSTYDDTLGSDHIPIIIDFNEQLESHDATTDNIPSYLSLIHI